MNCFLSTGAFGGQSLREIIPQCIEHDFDVELSSSVRHTPDMMNDIKPAMDQVRFLVHNYFPAPATPFVLNLASGDSAIHEKSVEHCRTAIDLCTEVGSPFYSVHAGFAFHLEPGDLGKPEAQRKLDQSRHFSREDAYQRFVNTVKELGVYARSRNTGLLIENNVVAAENLDSNNESPLLLTTPDEILRFFKDLDDPSVSMLLDVAHAKVSARTFGIRLEDYFEKLSPYIEALHLSDNDGLRDSNKPFDEDAWFIPFLADFRSKTFVIEAYRLTIDQMSSLKNTVQKAVT